MKKIYRKHLFFNVLTGYIKNNNVDTNSTNSTKDRTPYLLNVNNKNSLSKNHNQKVFIKVFNGFKNSNFGNVAKFF